MKTRNAKDNNFKIYEIDKKRKNNTEQNDKKT